MQVCLNQFSSSCFRVCLLVQAVLVTTWYMDIIDILFLTTFIQGNCLLM